MAHRKGALHQALRRKLSRGGVMQELYYPDVAESMQTRHKSALKAVAHKTNIQASVDSSVLWANLQLKANEDLARQIDRKGAHLIHPYE